MFAKSPKNGKDARLARYDRIIVHCTATPPNLSVDAAWVNREHLKRGFKNGCGYHAVITRNAEWEDRDSGYLARPIGNAGAHVGDCGNGWNGRSFGISLAGGIDHAGRPDANYTDLQLETLEDGIRRFLFLHPAPETIVLLGHRDLIRITGAPPKACPCFDVAKWWGECGNAPLDGATAPRKVAPFKAEKGCDEDEKTTKNPKLILPKSHLVGEGDSLWKISERYGISVSRLRALNGLKNDTIIAGSTLKIS